ncbi:hypothetical protein SAMN06272781_6908 [Streptomyces sp. 1222.2]|nr:hypothetical protein SAMN06272781_6908 [Streptomyces sp. 1222.2]
MHGASGEHPVAPVVEYQPAPTLRTHGFLDWDLPDCRGRLMLPALTKAPRPDSECRSSARLGLDAEEVVLQDGDSGKTRAIGCLRRRVDHAHMMPKQGVQSRGLLSITCHIAGPAPPWSGAFCRARKVLAITGRPPIGPCRASRSAGPAAPPGSPREAMRLSSVEQSQLGVGPAVRARGDAVGECAHGLVAGDALAALAGHVASADVYVGGCGVAVEALLDEPVWCGRSPFLAAVPLGLTTFLVCDPPPGAVEVSLLDAFEEAEQGESGRRTVVHVFDSRG